jgi:hypothetical protein
MGYVDAFHSLGVRKRLSCMKFCQAVLVGTQFPTALSLAAFVATRAEVRHAAVGRVNVKIHRDPVTASWSAFTLASIHL